MNLSGKEFRIREIWCERHGVQKHWVYFIRRDLKKVEVKKMIPYVMYTQICYQCYEKDLQEAKALADLKGEKFKDSNFVYDGIVQELAENDWNALWYGRF